MISGVLSLLTSAEGTHNSDLGDPWPWFVSHRSKVASDLCRSLSLRLHVPFEYRLIPFISTEHPHLPPGHSKDFFIEQLEPSLLLPIHPFLLKVLNCFTVPVNQLRPNFFRFMLCFYIILTYMEIIPFAFLFHYFFQLKLVESGVFYFKAQSEFQFCTGASSSNKS